MENQREIALHHEMTNVKTDGKTNQNTIEKYDNHQILKTSTAVTSFTKFILAI